MMKVQAPATREQRSIVTFERTERLRKIGLLLAYLILTVWAVLSVMPIYFMFTLSFQELGRYLSVRDIRLIPTHYTLKNYIELFQLNAPFWIARRPVWRWLLNSALVATVPTISNLIFDSAAGYALAKMRFPGRKLIFYTIVATMMIPGFVTFIPLYRMMFDFRWMDSYWALLFPGFAGVGGIFMMKQSIQTLPSSLLDAARIDACSEFRIFWKIVLPLSKPILAIVGITSFMGGWNEFFWPYLVARRQEMLTLQAGLSSMMGAGATGLPPATNNMGVVMAGSAIAAVPMIIVFFLFQKYIVQGITVGAMKG
ncbi:MAG: carbohydrate ABC transporter permease [Limnochordia bacterium]|jgi:multiple sugar transport system permease protein